MVIVKLESSVGRDLANAGSKTYGSSVSVTASLGSGKYLVGYRGSIEASGTWMKQTCTTSSLVTSAKWLCLHVANSRDRYPAVRSVGPEWKLGGLGEIIRLLIP